MVWVGPKAAHTQCGYTYSVHSGALVKSFVQVIDSSTLDEIATYPMMHTKSRLFRHSETGVTGLDILPGGKLFSCGVDGTVKCRTITL